MNIIEEIEYNLKLFYQVLGEHKKEKFDSRQLNEIWNGVQDYSDWAKVYADPKYDYEQMHQIYLSYQYDETEAFALIADEKFDGAQMEQIRLGFEQGLTMEEVLQYADSSISSWQMRDKKEQLLRKKQTR